MKAFCLSLALTLAVNIASAAPAVVLIVRHAEKEALPAGDPPLDRRRPPARRRAGPRRPRLDLDWRAPTRIILQ